jgi:hypothetical protein
MNHLHAASLDTLPASPSRPTDNKTRLLVREISVLVLVLGGFVGMLSMLLMNG